MLNSKRNIINNRFKLQRDNQTLLKLSQQSWDKKWAIQYLDCVRSVSVVYLVCIWNVLISEVYLGCIWGVSVVYLCSLLTTMAETASTASPT